jgi:hypothetical protein
MASILLSQLGGAIPVPGLNLGASILGAAGGAYVDSKWLGGLRGDSEEDRIKPYELAEIAPQQANEGAPLPFCLGPRCRTSGVVLWQGETRPQNDNGPLKGSSGAQQSGGSGTRFYKSIAVAYHYDRRIRIEQVDRIVAEGKTIYAAEGAISVSSNQLSTYRRVWKYVFSDGVPAGQTMEVWLEVISPSGGPDLQIFESGVDATLTGFSDAANNGTFECLGVETDESTGEQRARFRNLSAVTNDESGNPGARGIAQVLPETRGRFYDSITFYNGSPDQLADPIIEEAEGSGQVPAFRGFGYVVIERLRLDEFGGRLPQLTFLVRESSTRSVASAIAALCERAGLRYPAYDVSRVTGTLSGLVLAGVAPGASTLAPLLVAYDLTAREEGGRIVFQPRAEATLHDDIAEAEYGTNRDGDAVEYFDDDEARIPRELRLYFLDEANDLQEGKASAIYQGPGAYDIEEIRLGLVMSAQDASIRAHQLLWGRISNSRRMRTTLPPRRCYVREGDIVPHLGDEWLVVDRSIRDDCSIEIEAAREWNGTDWSSARATPAPENEVVQVLPPAHRLFRFDIAPLRDGENRGEYWGHVCLDPAVRDHGARLMRGSTATSLSGVQQIGIEAVAGFAETALGSASFEFPDHGHTVDILLLNGTLESTTMASVARGTNWAMLGREVIGFTTATLIGTRRYRLSGLLRGRRGTEQWVGLHSAGEEFLLLDQNRIKFHGVTTQFGSTFYATAISPAAGSGSIAPDAPIPYIYRAGTIRPFSPYPVWWDRDPVATTATLRWHRRSISVQSQIPNPARGSSDFRLELYDGPSGSGGIRLITVPANQLSFNRTATSWSYTFTAAALTAVGQTWNGTLTARVAEALGNSNNAAILSEYREITG